jgi:hypothetical protein
LVAALVALGAERVLKAIVVLVDGGAGVLILKGVVGALVLLEAAVSLGNATLELGTEDDGSEAEEADDDDDAGTVSDEDGRPVVGIHDVSVPAATRNTLGIAVFPRASVRVTWTELTSAGS